MAKYLFQASYTAEGARGLLREGGSARQEAVAKAIQGLGGALDAFYYAFGADDVYAIVDLPDDESAAAASLSIGATGLVSISTTKLLLPAQIDVAAKKSFGYRGPGA
jgi:uncharacterized protein with GYD domain